MIAAPTISDAFVEYLAERDKPTKARPYTVIGPLAVPAKASELAVVGWEASATHFVRSAKCWHLIEIGNVYPLRRG